MGGPLNEGGSAAAAAAAAAGASEEPSFVRSLAATSLFLLCYVE